MKPSVLLVDDDSLILETACDILESEGFTVKTAGTGAEALKILETHPCRVMIVDFNLPDVSGTVLTVQAKAARPDLQIILMSGEAHIDAGPAKDLLHSTLIKPVSPAQLIDVIRRICDG